MRVLLSAVGTRGDVQPIVALGLAVRALGHEVRLAVPPNFVAWASSSFGLSAVSVGIEMRAPSRGAAPLTEEQLRRMRESMPDLITDQFEKVGAAAEGCDVLLGGNAHQYAARSIAEMRGARYVTALYAPVAIPSPSHPPPPLPGGRWAPSADAEENLRRWADDARAWNARALDRVNANRARLGLSPIDDVLRFNVTERPWLASDPMLAPAPSEPAAIFQTGAWILDAPLSPLPAELDAFLAAGDAPVYFGLGSMPAPREVGRALVGAARAVGRRAIVSRGWADLEAEAAADVIAVDEVDQRVLFARVAAVVHHGGAGTTAAVARAGRPQVIAPMFSDQFYFATRVRELGIGESVASAADTDAVAASLASVLSPAVAAQAADAARALRSDGAAVAARALVEGAPRSLP